MTPRQRFARLRSVLEVPVLKEAYVVKVPNVAADGFMLDLEDSVPASAKNAARQRVRELLQSPAHFNGRLIAVRVNNLATDWGREDLAMLDDVAGDVLVCYPKAESASELALVSDAVSTGRADRSLWAMVETPRGVAALSGLVEVAGLAGLHFGYTDYGAEFGLSPFTPDGTALIPAMATAAQLVAIAAAGAGLFATGGTMIPHFRDAAGVAAFVESWVQAGFTGCLALSPAHVDVCNRLFAPSPEEVALAREALAAFDAAIAAGQANAHAGERLITLPEARRLRTLLARAE